MDESELQTTLANLKADVEKLKNIKDSKIINEKLDRLDEYLKWFEKMKDEIKKYLVEKHDDSAREDAKTVEPDEIPKHHVGDWDKGQAEQYIKSFNQNYDEGAIKNLHGSSLDEYTRKKALVQQLKNRFNI